MSFQCVLFSAIPRSPPRSGALTPGTLRRPPTSRQYLPSFHPPSCGQCGPGWPHHFPAANLQGLLFSTEYSSNSEHSIQGPSSCLALLRCAFHSCLCLFKSHYYVSGTRPGIGIIIMICFKIPSPERELYGLTLFTLFPGTWCCAKHLI